MSFNVSSSSNNTEKTSGEITKGSNIITNKAGNASRLEPSYSREPTQNGKLRIKQLTDIEKLERKRLQSRQSWRRNRAREDQQLAQLQKEKSSLTAENETLIKENQAFRMLVDHLQRIKKTKSTQHHESVTNLQLNSFHKPPVFPDYPFIGLQTLGGMQPYSCTGTPACADSIIAEQLQGQLELSRIIEANISLHPFASAGYTMAPSQITNTCPVQLHPSFASFVPSPSVDRMGASANVGAALSSIYGTWPNFSPGTAALHILNKRNPFLPALQCNDVNSNISRFQVDGHQNTIADTLQHGALSSLSGKSLAAAKASPEATFLPTSFLPSHNCNAPKSKEKDAETNSDANADAFCSAMYSSDRERVASIWAAERPRDKFERASDRSKLAARAAGNSKW